MRTIGHFKFAEPGNYEEAREWKPDIMVLPLASKVLAVGQTRIEGAWAAYIDAVDGRSHADEYHGVLESGNELPEKVARALFPVFNGVPYAE